MNRSRLLILLNGEIRKQRTVRRAARECAAVICADGGARHAIALGLKPRVILGDMDSLPARRPRWRDAVFLCDFDAERSDFEKALRFALERGYEDVWIADGFGGAMDHLMVNLALAERYSAKMRMRFVAEPEARILRPGPHHIRLKKGSRISLLTIGERCRVESTRGLLFALKNEWIERGSRGLANIATASTVRITITRGRAWAIF